MIKYFKASALSNCLDSHSIHAGFPIFASKNSVKTRWGESFAPEVDNHLCFSIFASKNSVKTRWAEGLLAAYILYPLGFCMEMWKRFLLL